MRAFLISLFLLPGLALAQAAVPEALSRADASWNSLRAEGKAEELARILDPGFTLIHSDGRVQYKSDYVAELATGKRRNGAIQNEDVRVRLYGDTAIVNGVSVQSGVTDGQPFSGRFRFTRVWQQRDGHWFLLSSHSSRVTAP